MQSLWVLLTNHWTWGQSWGPEHKMSFTKRGSTRVETGFTGAVGIGRSSLDMLHLCCLGISVLSGAQEQILGWGYRFEHQHLDSTWYQGKLIRLPKEREYKILGARTFKGWAKEEQSKKLNKEPGRWEANKKWIHLAFINVLFGPVPLPTPSSIPTKVKGRVCLKKNKSVGHVKRRHIGQKKDKDW